MSDIVNLLEETVQDLRRNGKSTSDVRWVGTTTWCMSWADFAARADEEYDSGYGAVEVESDLLVVGDDWWLERYVYDGSESWDFKTKPKPPLEFKNEPRSPFVKD